ncbi:MAG TPA: hypothetical protein VIU29_03385, partial [Candidatus Deferrimicrobiaceae bacterium]
MRSSSRHSGAALLPLLPLAPILLFILAGAAEAGLPGPSLSQMARIEASGEANPERDAILFHGYLALGLRRDAASLLERRLRSGMLSASQAAPRFEALLDVYGGDFDPDETAAVCRMADRNNVRKSSILYACGRTLLEKGNARDGAPFLGAIVPDDPLYPYALQALGQAAAAGQDYLAASAMFGRARGQFVGRPEEAARAALAQAECLLLLGRESEAIPLFEDVLSVEESPVARAGLGYARGDGSSPAAGEPSPESIAALPPRQRIFCRLLEAASARNANRFPAAFVLIEDAKATAGGIASQPAFRERTMALSTTPTESFHRAATLSDALRLRLDTALDDGHAAGVKPDLDRLAATGVDLILGLLVQGRLAGSIEGQFPSSGGRPERISREEVGLALDRLEEIVLRGNTIGRLAESISIRMGTLENIAHPIGRYRLLGRLENHRDNILEAGGRVRELRTAAANEIAGDGPPQFKRFLMDAGRLLNELEDADRRYVEADRVFRESFDIFREKADSSEDGSPALRLAIQKAIDFERAATARMSDAIAELESDRREELLALERVRTDALRSKIAFQEAEMHVAHARSLLEEMPKPGLTGEALAAALRAASFLGDGLLSPDDRLRLAVGLGFMAAARQERWVPFPENSINDGERQLTESFLPVLEAGGGTGQTAFDAAYLSALFGLRQQGRGAEFAAREFMKAHPGTERAADLSIRLAVRLVSRKTPGEAAALLDIAAGTGSSDTATAARALIGSLRLKEGNLAGSVAALSAPLSDPDAFCGTLSSFEDEVLETVASAWRGLPLDGLEIYPPIRDGRCGGRRLLELLGESEDLRGEPGRACQAYELLQFRFREHVNAPVYEARGIEERIRLGQERAAVPRMLALTEKFGPDSAWWGTAPPSLRESFRGSVVKSLRRLSGS